MSFQTTERKKKLPRGKLLRDGAFKLLKEFLEGFSNILKKKGAAKLQREDDFKLSEKVQKLLQVLK